jgi:hypothetical protein
VLRLMLIEICSAVRMQRHEENAKVLANFLEKHAKVAKVRYSLDIAVIIIIIIIIIISIVVVIIVVVVVVVVVVVLTL